MKLKHFFLNIQIPHIRYEKIAEIFLHFLLLTYVVIHIM